MNLDNRNAGQFLELVDSKLEELTENVGFAVVSASAVLGYVTLKTDGRKAQVTLKVEADRGEWITEGVEIE